MARGSLMFTGAVDDAIDFFDEALATGQISQDDYDAGEPFWAVLVMDINGDGISESDQGTVTFQFIDTGPASPRSEVGKAGGSVWGVWYSYDDAATPATADQLIQAYDANGIEFDLTAGIVEQRAAIAIPAYQDYVGRSQASEIDPPGGFIDYGLDILIL